MTTAENSIVKLRAERWAALKAFCIAHERPQPITDEITVFQPTFVGDILYLPARYQPDRRPDDPGVVPAAPNPRPLPALLAAFA